MGRPTLANSKDIKTELTKIAMELVQTRGYNGFSYQDLAERLNIRKASIHYYFPAKEDLGAGLMDAGLDQVHAWHEKLLAQKLTPTEIMEAYFDYYTELSKDATRICPCGALASEWENLPQKVRDAYASMLSCHSDFIKTVLEEGRASGEFAKKGTAEEQAQFVLASIMGSLQTARAQGNPDVFQALVSQLWASLKS
ncbi:MAG TPA: TetR/AcrR family transcriptional regulator [bacterium]|nr:TetR/AcrR family transcriptional regulator [bacterium]